MHERLRRETTALHRELEVRLALLDPSLDLERYRGVLEAFFGYYSPLERGVEALAAELEPLPLPLRVRAPLVERDLLALGVSAPHVRHLPVCAELPRLSTRQHLAGCAYVIEGASLGGQVVARSLRLRLGLDPQRGTAFFSGAGDVAPRWIAVLAWLEQVGASRARADEIVFAASETFRTLSCWLEHRGVLR